MLNLLAAFFNKQTIIMVAIVGVLLVVMIVLPMITNKKRQKAVDDMHARIAVGAKVKTVGGIVGTIVEIRENGAEKEFVLETGLDETKCTMVFDFNAIYQVMSDLTPAPAEENAEAAAENGEAAAENGEAAENAEATEAAAPADETAATAEAAEEAAEVTEAPAEEAPAEEPVAPAEKKSSKKKSKK